MTSESKHLRLEDKLKPSSPYWEKMKEKKNESGGKLKRKIRENDDYPPIHSSWRILLKDLLDDPSTKEMFSRIRSIYARGKANPKYEHIFRWTYFAKPNDVKAVIIGQDPYPDGRMANGLAFSCNVSDGKLPPSLKNIGKLLETDVGKQIPINGNLEKWAKQGVLLLNRILTFLSLDDKNYQELLPLHRQIKWKTFTDKVIQLLSRRNEHIVYLLWGKIAHQVESVIETTNKRNILKASHPSPACTVQTDKIVKFNDSKHFSRTNELLKEWKLTPIDW
ncbi:hypothetical protein SNEBB_000818 [Seison nebaliae]|nr:hypothetical protein SNEBB_000818 [Seison nebaliae]